MAALRRLSVNLPQQVMTTLTTYARRKEISQTEAVRRAIAVLAYVDSAQERGAAVHVAEPDGSEREVQFLV